MHILITNDDGVTAPGLLALAQAMRQFGQVSIVAPDHDWSGYGHTKHFKRPLRIEEVTLKDGTHAFATDGSPADCVALAAMGLLDTPIDIVLAGINSAANVGYDLTYSGTVAAVKEAMIWRIPGIAFSLDVQRKPDPNYSLAAAVACQVMHTIIDRNLPTDTSLNVNVPNIPTQHFRGFQITRTGHRVYRDNLEIRTDPRGNSYFWIGGDVPVGIPQEGTDIGALALGYASITPLQLDYTDYNKIPMLMNWDTNASQPIPVSANGKTRETAVPLAV
ncbi:MAG: 5'/3'-nucleotidase SurE [Anaerolineae bacterium]|nr:5'/3'-nucleotidase SurE [Anaerolineae bacterium]